MGLLDSVLGSVLNAQQGAGSSGQGGLAALLPVVVGMLANNGEGGGLAGLKDKFNQAGLGDMLQQWIATGPNPAISGEQLGQVLGVDTLDQIAAQLGVDPGQAAGQVAHVLPGLIDGLTPSGQAPQGGFGNAGDLLGMLGAMLQK